MAERQQMDALEIANRHRSAERALKAELKAGTRASGYIRLARLAEDVLTEDVPEDLNHAKLMLLLRAVPYVGRTHAQRVLNRADISLGMRLRDLCGSQVQRLAGLLESEAFRVASARERRTLSLTGGREPERAMPRRADEVPVGPFRFWIEAKAVRHGDLDGLAAIVGVDSRNLRAVAGGTREFVRRTHVERVLSAEGSGTTFDELYPPLQGAA